MAKHYAREENIRQPQRAQNHVSRSDPNLEVVWYAERQTKPDQKTAGDVNNDTKRSDASLRLKNLSVLVHRMLRFPTLSSPMAGRLGFAKHFPPKGHLSGRYAG
jgi:hypothetical protein